MARPRTPIGTFGEIEFTRLPNGTVRARTRFRDHDGQLRRIEASGDTRTRAEHRLKEKLAARGGYSTGFGELTPDSPFSHLVDIWLEDLDLEGKLAGAGSGALGSLVASAASAASASAASPVATIRPPTLCSRAHGPWAQVRHHGWTGSGRNYILGWDTASRRAFLQAAIPAQQQAVEAAETEATRRAARRSEHADRRAAIKQIAERYPDLSLVDVGRAHDRLREAEELYALFFADSNLAQLEDERTKIRQRIAALDEKRSSLDQRVGDTRGQVTRYEEQLRDTHMLLASAEAAGPLPQDAQTALDEAAAQAGPRPLSVTKVDAWATNVRKALDERIASSTSTSTRDRAGQRLINSMTRFADDWREAVRDLRTDDVDSRGEYLAIRDRLERDDLPRFEQNFRDELQRNAIQEIVGFSVFLDTESKKITGRIDTINTALHDIDYRPGTHIKLEAVPTVDPVIRDFKSQLKDITSDTLFEDAYAEDRFLKVKDLLDRFAGREGQTADDQRWTTRVTDVRNWFSFAGSERKRDTDEEVEHYEDSGGKSGGQKEKLAYTVLAASLAYQYGLAGGRTEAFRFVMIDEAFGRGSDDSTRYGLQLFGQLGLQLLVVTPLQKVGTIEPFVEAVGYVYPAPDGLRSRLLPMTISECRERRAARQLAVAQTVLGDASLGGPAA